MIQNLLNYCFGSWMTGFGGKIQGVIRPNSGRTFFPFLQRKLQSFHTIVFADVSYWLHIDDFLKLKIEDLQVNVVAKRCGHTNCSVNPRFNYEGQTRGLYCSEHKLPGKSIFSILNLKPKFQFPLQYTLGTQSFLASKSFIDLVKITLNIPLIFFTEAEKRNRNSYSRRFTWNL